MGSFGQSLSRELGKNTGKVISNTVFGNKWSTPSRVSISTKNLEIRASQAIAQADALKKKAELDYDLTIDKIKLEQKFESQKEQDMLLNDVIQFSFNTDKDTIFEGLNKLYSIAESTDSDKLKVAAIEKVKAGIFKLQQIGANKEADYFQNKFDEKEKIRENLILSQNRKKKKAMKVLLSGFASFILAFLFNLPEKTVYYHDGSGSYQSKMFPNLVVFIPFLGIGLLIWAIILYSKSKK